MNKALKYSLCVWSLFFMAIYPAVFLYGQNLKEVSPKEFWNCSTILALSYCVIFILNLLFTRNFLFAATLSFFIIIIGNYFFLILKSCQLLFPLIKYWHLMSIIIAIWAVSINYAKKKIKHDILKAILILFIVSANFFATFNITPILSYHINKKDSIHKGIEDFKGSNDTAYPNIYYLVFDEYSSTNFMKKYYYYNNDDFLSQLEQLNFNISLTSSNEAYKTQICMTNILNLDYLFDMNDDSDPKKQEIIHQKRVENVVFNYLKDKGYLIHGIGDADFYGLEDISGAETIDSSTVDGKSFRQLVFQNIFLQPFIKDDTSKKLLSLKKNIAYIKNTNFVGKNPVFVLLHLELPHTPFVVDRRGNSINPENRSNWSDKKYYLDQYIYASEAMLDIVSSIIDKDKYSVIVLCSDHSARSNDEFEEKDKCQIFNAVYFRGDKLNIEGLSGINTMRALFNNLFDTNYTMLETLPLETTEEYKNHEITK